MTFEIDLAKGKEVESLVAGQLRKRYPCTTIINGKWSGYDIWIPELHEGVEVKYDPMSLETGNYIIEYRCNGKDSGITTTKAGAWMIYDGIDVLVITPAAIRKCIDEQPLSWRRRANMIGPGDPYMKDVYLIEKEALRGYGKVNTLEG